MVIINLSSVNFMCLVSLELTLRMQTLRLLILIFISIEMLQEEAC